MSVRWIVDRDAYHFKSVVPLEGTEGVRETDRQWLLMCHRKRVPVMDNLDSVHFLYGVNSKQNSWMGFPLHNNLTVSKNKVSLLPLAVSY